MSKNVSAYNRAFRETLVEFFQQTSLNGFGLLYNIRRRKYQRLLWFMFILMGISFATYVVCFTLIPFLADPTVTSLGSQNYPIWQIPFPAVAVCSVNKLSRRAVHDYARQMIVLDFLHNSKPSSRSWHMGMWLKKLELFAGYFDAEAVDYDEAIELQDELDVLMNAHNYNTTAILRQLSPTCEDMLLECSWVGEVTECQELFALHTTAVGNCCIFNYQRGAADESEFQLKYPMGTGHKLGLTLLLNSTSNDYFYKQRSTNGFTVQIFAPNNFPDATTGAVQELFVAPGEDVDAQLLVTTQVTTAEVYAYAAAKRHCYFAEEHVHSAYGLAYSKAECLTRCKVYSVRWLCGCLPYYTPIDFIDWNATVPYCTLSNVECLARYSVTWNNYRPDATVFSAELPQDLQQDTIMCANCLPLCTYNQYRYTKSSRELSRNNIELQRLQHKLDVKQTSLVKLYFATPYSMQYQKNVIYNWYQILSNIGGVIGICMGCSLISGFEVIYFIAYRYFKNFCKIVKK